MNYEEIIKKHKSKITRWLFKIIYPIDVNGATGHNP